MQYVSFLLIPIAIMLLFSWSKNSNAKKEIMMSPDSLVLKPGLLVLIVGVAGSVFFALLIVLMYAFPNDTASIWIALSFGLFIILGVFLIVHYFTYRISFNDENIIKYRIFKNRIIDYKNISYMKLVGNDNTPSRTLGLYNANNKSLLKFDSMCIGFDLAIKKLEALNIRMETKPYNTFKDLR